MSTTMLLRPRSKPIRNFLPLRIFWPGLEIPHRQQQDLRRRPPPMLLPWRGSGSLGKSCQSTVSGGRIDDDSHSRRKKNPAAKYFLLALFSDLNLLMQFVTIKWSLSWVSNLCKKHSKKVLLKICKNAFQSRPKRRNGQR